MLTPTDIENKVFKKTKFNGYDINDVEDYLEKIIVDYENLFKQNMEIKDKMANLQESVAYYKSLEVGIDQTVGNAQIEAENIKEEALNLADKIKKDAMKEVAEYKKSEEEKYQEKLDDIKKQIMSKEVELEELKKQMQIYKVKTVAMLEAQIKILKEKDPVIFLTKAISPLCLYKNWFWKSWCQDAQTESRLLD